MSRSTISTFQLFALFPDEETARRYLEGRLWPNGPMCPDCKSGERVSALGVSATRKPGYYRCLACDFDFTIRTNTVFERSKVPLNKWVYAMYLLVTARKGISSLQLAKEIGVTQKTAWFILGRLREACGGLHGVYHHASKKHLFRYVDEFMFRLNEGAVENHTLERLDSFVSATAGKRLTYARLIA